VCILAAAFAIRYQAVWWGMPDLLYGDEVNNSLPSNQLMTEGSIHPYHYFYPQTFTTFQTVAVISVDIFRTITGMGPIWLHRGVWDIYLIGRFTSLAMGIAAIFLIFLIGRKAYNAWVGLGAAIMLAVYPAFVEYNTYAKPDSCMIFWALASIYASLLVFEKGKLGHYILAALFAGLAMGSKYQGSFVLVSLLAAHMLNAVKQRKTFLKMVFSWPILVTAVCTVAGYLVGNLHQFVNLSNLLQDMSWFQLILGISGGGHLFTLANLLILAGAALVLLIRRNPYDLLIGSFTLTAYFFVGHGRYHDQMLFYIPLYLLVSVLAVAIAQWLIAHLRRLKPLFILLLLGFMGWFIYPNILTIPRILDANGYYLTGARVQARNWVLQNIPSGASIQESYPAYGGIAELPRGMYFLNNFFTGATGEEFLITYSNTQPDYVITTTPFSLAVLKSSGLKLVKEFKEASPASFFGSRYYSGAEPKGIIDIYKSATDRTLSVNIYTTLRLSEPRTSAIRSASFDDPSQVSRDWFFQAGGDHLETAKNVMEGVPQGINGSNVLHLMTSNPNGAGMAEAIQVVPHANIDEFANFQMDVFPVENEIAGCCARINLTVTAQSIGGADLGEQTYHLFSMGQWDWVDAGLDVSSDILAGNWNTFTRNIRLDLERSGVRWDWVGFLVVRLQVETNHAGSAAGVYFDNLHTSANPSK
jgi:hypothetical protein